MNSTFDKDLDKTAPATRIVRVITFEEVRRRIRATIIAEGSSVAEWAKKHNLSKPYVFQLLKGDRPPTERIGKLLGLEIVKGFRDPKRTPRSHIPRRLTRLADTKGLTNGKESLKG